MLFLERVATAALRASLIIEPKYLAVSQVIRVKLYNSGLLFFYKNFPIVVFTYISPSLS
jgi:hypothetical protein